jgi:hypothetical protein
MIRPVHKGKSLISISDSISMLRGVRESDTNDNDDGWTLLCLVLYIK